MVDVNLSSPIDVRNAGMKALQSLAKLERDIDGITQKMLLEQLKELMDL